MLQQEGRRGVGGHSASSSLLSPSRHAHKSLSTYTPNQYLKKRTEERKKKHQNIEQLHCLGTRAVRVPEWGGVQAVGSGFACGLGGSRGGNCVVRGGRMAGGSVLTSVRLVVVMLLLLRLLLLLLLEDKNKMQKLVFVLK